MKLHERKDMKIDDLSRNQRNIIALLEIIKEGSSSELSQKLGLPKRTFLDNVNFLIKNDFVKKSGVGKSTFYSRVIINEYIAKEITVFKEGVRFGVLEFGTDGFGFLYDKNYKGEKPDNLMEQKNRPDLFPEFENLIPEYARRDKLIREYNSEYLSELLIHLKNSHGAYDFINSYEEGKYISDYSKRPSWYSVKNKILGENDYPNVLSGFNLKIDNEILKAKTKGEHSHLSGNQNKVDINIDFENKNISEVTNDEIAQYLLKPYSEDLSSYFEQFKKKDKGYYPHIAINEHLFMSFAKNELGFNVPYTALIEGEREFHYITKRYDRYENYKYHQKDFAQYLNIDSTKKYKTTSEKLFSKLNEVLYNEEEKFNA
jgi:serine/threonine-protein kinase HipA